VNVVSKKGEGTTFQVYVPVYKDGTESHVVSATNEPLRGNGQHIVFVDDEPAICGVTEHVLQTLGYRVTTYTDPMVALESFKKDPKAVDLLLSDVNMPGMNGVELAKRFLTLRRELPVLLISGFSGNWTPENVRPLGILDLLQKPISPRQIGTHLHRALNTKRINAEAANGPSKITFTKAPFSAK
jgi:DNA-binding NtrC family response regulator